MSLWEHVVEEVTLDIVSRKNRAQKKKERRRKRVGGMDSLQGHVHNYLTLFHFSPPSNVSTTSQYHVRHPAFNT